MTEMRQVSLTVNGVVRTGETEARTTLADFLRNELRLTGTHLGCEHGVCGACTVILGGVSVRSCTVLAIQAEGTELLTVEGLAKGGELHPLQEAFSRAGGLQCGFCTPGFLMTAYELIESKPSLDERGVREWVSGNICRCTGYQGIVDAIVQLLDAALDVPIGGS